MKSLYPRSFGDIRSWAAENRVTVFEARQRFVQYAILRAIASSRALSQALVLKGGNALDFVWQPNRSTRDLDFSVDMTVPDYPLSDESLRSVLAPALGVSERSLGVAFRTYGIDRQPPGPEKTFITYRVSVGYALPDDSGSLERMRRGVPVSSTIPLDISLNEPICSDSAVDVDGTFPLRVSDIEDIVAEKLRALLQQRIRNRFRHQDLLDIAVIRRSTETIDVGRVSAFLMIKAAARDVPVSRRAFADPEFASRAREGYEALASTTRSMFIPFDEALAELMELVAELDIPA